MFFIIVSHKEKGVVRRCRITSSVLENVARILSWQLENLGSLKKTVIVYIYRMKNTYRHFLAFCFFMITIQMIQYLFYMDSYLDAFSVIGKREWNFGTNYKNVFWYIAIPLGYPCICFYLYTLYYTYKVPLKYLIPFNIFWNAFWDVCPILMIDDAYKQLFILLFDSVWAGGVWLLAIPIFNKYYSILKHYVPLLFMTYIISIMIVFYKMYIYNREGNNNNLIVKLGDKLHLDKILSYLPRV
jgi:hypothetical protein